ncbi:AAA family ATPase [Modestobacter sp. KNN46-3]|uniref:AAA family ATPase n=1 Tax=Modestobacter sp. KNN46-3 TaxID=2711218 RepID=UPI0013E02D47|nr:AAA family ATPase [Modestobacter sp. KNN46-3]
MTMPDETSPFDLADWADVPSSADVTNLDEARAAREQRTERRFLDPLDLEQQRAAALIREQARQDALRELAEKAAEERLNKPALEVANVDDLPMSLLGEATSIEQEDIEAAMVTRPVTLFDAMRMARKAKAAPTALEFAAAEGALLYRGKSNGISGESGKGKSTIAKMAVHQEAVGGRCALFIDREKDVANFCETMVEFGDLTDEQMARVFYWNPTKSTAELMPVILGFAKKYGIDLVVIDSVSRDLIKFSPTSNENDNNDVRRWYDACVDPLVRFGLTPFLIDHVTKPQDGPGGPKESLYAKGAAAKREVITGHAMMTRSVVPFARGVAGWSKVVCAKDNNGTFAEGSVVAEFHATPGAGRTVFELRPSSQAVDENGKALPTVLMERVSAFLAEAGPGQSTNKVVTNVKGNEDAIKRAVQQLVKDEYVTVETGAARGATLYTLARPYSQEADARVKAAKTAAASAAPGGFGTNGKAGSWSNDDPF